MHLKVWLHGHFISGPHRPCLLPMTLAQPQCHWQHDTETELHNRVQRCVCSWPSPSCSPQFTPGTRLG